MKNEKKFYEMHCNQIFHMSLHLNRENNIKFYSLKYENALSCVNGMA